VFNRGEKDPLKLYPITSCLRRRGGGVLVIGPLENFFFSLLKTKYIEPHGHSLKFWQSLGGYQRSSKKALKMEPYQKNRWNLNKKEILLKKGVPQGEYLDYLFENSSGGGKKKQRCQGMRSDRQPTATADVKLRPYIGVPPMLVTCWRGENLIKVRDTGWVAYNDWQSQPGMGKSREVE